MRPPELRFIRSQILYAKWFQRRSVTKLYNPEKSLQYLHDHLSISICNSEWLDGFNFKICLRRAALESCLDLIRQTHPRVFGIGTEGATLKRGLFQLLERLTYLYNLIELKTIQRRVSPTMKEQWANLSELFLSHSTTRKKLPILWFTPVYPKRKTAFLIQLLLSMGEFETEYELMTAGNLRHAFISAGLYNPSQPGQSLDALLTRYILQHLRTFHGSQYQFDRNLCLAQANLQELLLGTTASPVATPAVLYSHMKNECNQKNDDYIQQERSRLIGTLFSDLTKCGFGDVLPDRERVQAARENPMTDAEILFYPPPKCPRQNEASHTEQCHVLDKANDCMTRYMNPVASHMNLAIVGGPGVGKTTIAQFITLYALCKGLNGTVTSLVADRSKQLGGTHMHHLFGLHGVDITRSPGRIAERTIHDLFRKPELMWLLRSLDFLNIDELGPVSAEFLAILDMILHFIRHSVQFMGGIFIFTTIDIRQLLPFVGSPAMLSMFIITEFRFIELTQSVRASGDPYLQEICKLTRTVSWTAEKKRRLAELLSQHCNFVGNFNDPSIPEDAVFVFGRKAPCKEAERLMLDRMKAVHRGNYVISKSLDEESTTAGNWRPAFLPTSERLSRFIKRRKELVLYPNARFEFTYNGERGHFMQGQLAILLEVPSLETVNGNHPITVFKGPSGIKEFPPLPWCTEDGLIQLGWIKTSVPYSTSRPQTIFGGIQGRRTQYGLRPRVASTIHACMGSTFSTLVTCLVPLSGSPLDFGLWECAQVIVVLSRTHEAQDMYFVGDKHLTIQHILTVLEKTHQFLPYIINLLTRLCQETTETPVYELPPLYRPCDSIIGPVPCVYLLVSTKETAYTYIGETSNMAKRLHQHSTGSGAKVIATNPSLQPWALLCFVTGFTVKQERQYFEALWKETTRRLHATHAETILHIAKDLVEQHNHEQPMDTPLRLVRCGHILSKSMEHH